MRNNRITGLTPTDRKAITRRVFQADIPVICRRHVHWGETSFNVGDYLPWRDLGIPVRKMMLLFRARKVRHEIEADRIAKPAEKPVEAPVKPIAEVLDKDVSTPVVRSQPKNKPGPKPKNKPAGK